MYGKSLGPYFCLQVGSLRLTSRKDKLRTIKAGDGKHSKLKQLKPADKRVHPKPECGRSLELNHENYRISIKDSTSETRGFVLSFPYQF